MNKRMNKMVRAFSLTLTAGALTASAASAQVVQRLPTPDNRPIVINSNNRKVPPVQIERVAGGDQAWPVVVAAVAAVVMAGTEVAHRVTESWHPGLGGLQGRGGLVQAGAYDR